MNRLTAVSAGCISALLITLMGATTASAAPSQRPTASVAASTPCNEPTSANPGSVYVGSYSNCLQCEALATLWTELNPQLIYYCTYNPSNGLSDLHYDRAH
jgi:hypothetical protein